MALVDSRGRAASLGRQLGRGGEGIVSEVVGRPELVAKIYHKTVPSGLAAKLTAMVGLRTERLLGVAAWPMETLHFYPGGPVVGLLMPRVSDFKAIHSLYGPKTRLVEFPNASWAFLVHAASNLARAFAAIHEHGHVIGDVNHGNALVSSQATVKLIDCDSFQVKGAGRNYLCEVGVSTHQPPEFQSLSSFRGVVRTPNHDNFGLAVLIFQLLMMGRHPFSGRYLGGGEMPIERAIREYRFAYGSAAAARQMQPPPSAPPLECLSLPVASLFGRAFSPEGSRDGTRPTAIEWVNALAALPQQLLTCVRNPNHTFLYSLSSCPWCAVESGAGVLLFTMGTVRVAVARSQFSLEVTWAAICAVASPGPAPVLPHHSSLGAKPTKTARKAGERRRLQKWAAVAVGCVGIVVTLLGLPWGFVPGGGLAWFVLSHKTPKQLALRKDVAAARQRWGAVKARWEQEAGDRAFRDKLRELEQARKELLELPAKRARGAQELQSRGRERQLQRFLDQQRLATARISGIGPGREAVLSSYGIETAADIAYGRIVGIPGFGPALTGKLVAWRQEAERKFVFDPKKAVDPSDLAALDAELRIAQRKHEQSLSAGASQLRTLAEVALKRRQELQPDVDATLKLLAQAEANWKAAW